VLREFESGDFFFLAPGGRPQLSSLPAGGQTLGRESTSHEDEEIDRPRERSTIPKGSRVLANWKGTGSFYPGIVVKMNNQKYYVAYDSSAEEWLSRESLVLLKSAKASELDIGTEAYALIHEPQGEWIPSTITAIEVKRCLLSYPKNGVPHHKWVPVEKIVLREH
jgi:hypothetical protein